MAGPRGFEPPVSGSEGRRLDPDWATDPQRLIALHAVKEFPLGKTLIIGIGLFYFCSLNHWAGSSAWLERSADNRKVESSNLSRPTSSARDATNSANARI